MLNANTFFLLTFIVKLQYSAQTHVPILSVVKHYFGINLVPYWLSNFIFRCAPLHKFIFLQLLLLNSAVYFGTNSRFFYFDFQTVQYFSTNSCLFIVCCKILQYFWHKFMHIYILLSKLRYFGTNWYSYNFCCHTTVFWHKFMFLYLLLSHYSILAQTHAMRKKPTKPSRCQYGQVAWHPWKTWTKYTITQYKNKYDLDYIKYLQTVWPIWS